MPERGRGIPVQHESGTPLPQVQGERSEQAAKRGRRGGRRGVQSGAAAPVGPLVLTYLHNSLRSTSNHDPTGHRTPYLHGSRVYRVETCAITPETLLKRPQAHQSGVRVQNTGCNNGVSTPPKRHYHPTRGSVWGRGGEWGPVETGPVRSGMIRQNYHPQQPRVSC